MSARAGFRCKTSPSRADRLHQARPELGRPFLVAITGWGAPEDRLKSKQAGFDEHLTKRADISMIELLPTTLSAR
jgi:hypothetical protein